MSTPAYKAVLRALCGSLTANQAIRVTGKQEGYRCKATYSLLPQLHVSPLSMALVNDIACAVDRFCREHSRVPSFAPDFFFEVCVKVNRTGQYMVKLSLLNRALRVDSGDEIRPHNSAIEATDLEKAAAASALNVATDTVASGETAETLFDLWKRSAEPAALEDYLRAHNPGLVALIAHVRLPSVAVGTTSALTTPLHRKPDKDSAYVPCTRDGATALLEYTPNGHPFWLSADSFCEVNHEMEDAIYETIVRFLRLAPEASVAAQSDSEGVSTKSAFSPLQQQQRLHRSAFVCGRDVNSVVRTFEGFYDSSRAVTTCPCVYADTQRNGIAHCVRCAKDRICEELRGFALPPGAEDAEPQSNAVERRSDERHVLITAGRHGLHPSTTTALTDLGTAGHLSDLVYVSCNVESLTRDVHVLKEAWYIASARTFDFFPGTDYVMTVLHLRPLAGGDLLVLPVGLPGTGKSTSGCALDTFFHDAQAVEDASSVVVVKKRPRKTARQEEGENGTENTASSTNISVTAAAPTCHIPRTLLALRQHAVLYRHVERDQIFHAQRRVGGLKVARQRTHEALVASLGVWESSVMKPYRRVLYLDSTNGSHEARNLYITLWGTSSDATHGSWRGVGSAGVHSATMPLPASCLVLFFDPPASTDVLLHRVQQRVDHPSFPTDEREQQRKLDVIAAALKENQDNSESRTAAADSVELAVGSGCSARSSVVIRHIRASAEMSNAGAASTVQEVVLTVCAHLLFSRDLAALLLSDALEILRG